MDYNLVNMVVNIPAMLLLWKKLENKYSDKKKELTTDIFNDMSNFCTMMDWTIIHNNNTSLAWVGVSDGHLGEFSINHTTNETIVDLRFVLQKTG